jgi:hypothetical protein
MQERKQWRDLTSGQQTLVLVAASIELALTTTALAVLLTTPAGRLRGPRGAWLAALAVQPIGPAAFLLLGRRPASLRAD